MRTLSDSEIMLVAGGFNKPQEVRDDGKRDRDGDGDYDQFDRIIIAAEQKGVPLNMDERANLAWANALHEVAEDVAELFDDNPDNNSFFDGGNGSGNETPSPG